MVTYANAFTLGLILYRWTATALSLKLSKLLLIPNSWLFYKKGQLTTDITTASFWSKSTCTNRLLTFHMATDGFSKLFTKTNKPVDDLEEIIIGLIFTKIWAEISRSCPTLVKSSFPSPRGLKMNDSAPRQLIKVWFTVQIKTYYSVYTTQVTGKCFLHTLIG